jgi:carbohydrate-selective porin OprB
MSSGKKFRMTARSTNQENGKITGKNNAGSLINHKEVTANVQHYKLIETILIIGYKLFRIDEIKN